MLLTKPKSGAKPRSNLKKGKAKRHVKPIVVATSLKNGMAKSSVIMKPLQGLPYRASNGNGRTSASKDLKSKKDIDATVAELVSLQRQRVVMIKSCLMQENRMRAVVAVSMGYNAPAKMADKERKERFAKAQEIINRIAKGEDTKIGIEPIIRANLFGVQAFRDALKNADKNLVRLAKQLPAAAWAQRPEQRGFGLKSLGIVVGECGNLSNYSNPGKVWRRLGCAPWTFNGKTFMGSTWKSGHNGKDKISLPQAEWEQFGYAPRRRSVAYLIGENIVKQNFLGDPASETDLDASSELDDELQRGGSVEIKDVNVNGPYRARYIEGKVRAHTTHPEWDWKPCTVCGDAPNPSCGTCGGIGVKCGRAHKHGMLLATKRLLRELWIEWNK